MVWHQNNSKWKVANYKFVDLIEYCNFDTKFAFIIHQIKKIMKFFIQFIIVGTCLELALVISL
jgi:hypothetical protein